MSHALPAIDVLIDATNDQEQPLGHHVNECISQFLSDAEHLPDNLYELCLAQVEPALIQAVLRHVGGNQSQAAKVLGMSRGTLRKKCNQYSLDKV